MSYLEQLRAASAKKVLAGGTAPTKLTEPHKGANTDLPKPTKPSFVSSAGAAPHTKTFSGQRAAAIASARDASGLDRWREALALGRLHLCGNCARYTFGADPAGAGTCALHGDGLLAFAMPFDCADFTMRPAPYTGLESPDRREGPQ